MEESGSAAVAELVGAPYYLSAATLAVLIALAHLLAPNIRRLLPGREAIVASIGGGMAVAYAFLHLLPELSEGHGLLLRMIFAVPLIGFLVQYAIKHRVQKLDREDARSKLAYWIKLLNLWVYNWLIVYGTPSEHLEVGIQAAPLHLAILLHLIHNDYAFGEESSDRFDASGRWLLALAPIFAYATIVLERRYHEDVNTILTAFLAGSILYNVFSEEVPDDTRMRLRWFLLGTLGFAGLVAFSLDW